MASVIKAGAIVGDTEFLNTPYGSGVFNGDGGVVGQRMQKQLASDIHRHVDVQELNDAHNFAAGWYRNAHHGTTSFEPSSAAIRIDDRVVINVFNHQG